MAQTIPGAKREIAEDLPDGPDTPDQVLLCITDDERGSDIVIGYVWYRPDKNSRSAFVSDFHILPTHLGNGYGKRALSTLKAALSEKGFEQIRLRVAADNELAHHIYRTGGFRTTGINMSKWIGKA